MLMMTMSWKAFSLKLLRDDDYSTVFYSVATLTYDKHMIRCGTLLDAISRRPYGMVWYGEYHMHAL